MRDDTTEKDSHIQGWGKKIYLQLNTSTGRNTEIRECTGQFWSSCFWVILKLPVPIKCYSQYVFKHVRQRFQQLACKGDYWMFDTNKVSSVLGLFLAMVSKQGMAFCLCLECKKKKKI